MANIDPTFSVAHGLLLANEQSGGLNLLGSFAPPPLSKGTFRYEPLSPQQERLIRRILEKCPVDQIQKIKG